MVSKGKNSNIEKDGTANSFLSQPEEYLAVQINFPFKILTLHKLENMPTF